MLIVSWTPLPPVRPLLAQIQRPQQSQALELAPVPSGFAPVDEVAQATEPLRLVSAAAYPAVSPGSSLQEPAEGGADAGSPGGDAGQGNDLVQVETRTSGAQQLAA